MPLYVAKKLAFATLVAGGGGPTPSPIYTPSGSSKGLIHNILLCNDNSTAEDVVLLIDDGVNELPIFKVEVGAGESVTVGEIGEGYVLENGDTLTGYTTTSSMVTCAVFGSERTETLVEGLTLDDVHDYIDANCA